MLEFDFEEERIAKEILKKKANKVLIQLPDGLKPHGFRILEKLEEKTGAIVYLSAGPCYGGCDLAVKEAEDLGSDLIVHYGHTSLIENLTVPIIYVKSRIILEKSTFLNEIEKEFSPGKKIGVASTVQYLEIIENVRKSLESIGCNVIIPPKMYKHIFCFQLAPQFVS